MYEYGLVSVSFRKESPEDILKEMHKAGLTCIEWGSDIHAPKDDKERLQQLLDLQEKYQVKCCSYGSYFRLGETPIEELEGYLEAAKFLGTNIVRLWAGVKNSQDYTEDEKQEFFDLCKKAAEIAQKHQVILCMECHGGTYTNRKDPALELMRTVNSPNFRMYWQPNAYKTEEENIQYAELVSDYVEHLHVFNWHKDKRFPLMEAVDSWKRYLQVFKEKRALLLEFLPDDKLSSLKTEAEALIRIGEI